MMALEPFAEALANARHHATPDCSAVRAPLTPTEPRQRGRRKRSRRPIEPTDYAAMMRRLIRAYGLRVRDADMEDLADMLAVRDEFDAVIAQTVTATRERHGRSWADIGRAAGVTKQTAHERWGQT